MTAVRVARSRLAGEIRLPPSKSFLHRELICRTLAGDWTWMETECGVQSQDISATKSCLEKIFFSADVNGGPVRLCCRESGSTLRFLIPIVAALGRSAVFQGQGRLPERPLGEYDRLLSGKGVSMSFPSGDRFLPLSMSGQLCPGLFLLPGDVSSQFITGLLLALPLLPSDSVIRLTSPLESESYVRMTVSVMEAFGVKIQRQGDSFSVEGGQSYRKNTSFQSEADFSQAAFWLVLKYLGHDVEIENLPISSVQGDSAVQSILAGLHNRRSGRPVRESGMIRTVEEEGVSIVELDMSQIPDLAPVLSVAAAATLGVTRFVRAGRLRIKECDRLSASCEMLAALGIRVREERDSFTVFGMDISADAPGFTPGIIRSHGDHRMVMAGAVAATCADGVTAITDPCAVDKSYPFFFRDLRDVGGKVYGIDVGE